MKKGFSLIEFIIVVAILGILAGVAIPNIVKFYRAYKYNEYVLQVGSTLKWARLTAMERGINVGICSVQGSISVIDSGTSRNINCGQQALRSVRIETGDQSFVGLDSINLPAGFDPRGLAFIGVNNVNDARIRIRRTDGVNACTEYVIRNMSGLIERRQCQ